MFPLAEVMDKMPLFNEVAITTVVIMGLFALAAAWRPLLGTLIVLVAIHLFDWFGPSLWAMYETFEAGVGDGMRKEDPTYWAFARSIPAVYMCGVLICTVAWFKRRKKRASAADLAQ